MMDAARGQRPFFFHHHSGYRRNPFGALDDDEWADVALLPEVVTAVLHHPVHIQLLGPMGVGKSSVLLAIQRELRGRGQQVAYEYIPAGQRSMRTSLSGLDVFCLDEAQRLSWRWRRRLRRAQGRIRLCLGSHADLSAQFTPGAIVTIDMARQVTAAYWQQTLARRLAYFALPGAPAAMLTPDAVEFLYTTFGCDLRAGEYFLYEVWQGLATAVPLTAADLQRRLQEVGD